jgi:hypothetical protein
MKKFLVMLMVVAMASFLFVGCLPGVTPDVDDDDEEEEVVVVTTTVAPVILTVAGISITSSATQYINATEAAVVTVTGTAPTYSEVKVYVDAICAGTANVGDTGTFTVVIAEADLGADGDKVIYATAKEAALPVSAHSVEYAFILDQVKPGIDSVAASADADSSVTVTLVSGTDPLTAAPTTDGTGTLAAGTWVITCFGDSTSAASNVVITSAGVSTSYEVTAAATEFDGVIPGIKFTFVNNFDAGDAVKIVLTGVVADRYTLKFDEDVSFTGAAAGVYDILVNGVAQAPGDPDTYKEGNDTGYWNNEFNGLAVGDTVTLTVHSVTDLAGNVGGTAASPLIKTCYAGAASATALKP